MRPTFALLCLCLLAAPWSMAAEVPLTTVIATATDASAETCPPSNPVETAEELSQPDLDLRVIDSPECGGFSCSSDSYCEGKCPTVCENPWYGGYCDRATWTCVCAIW